MEHAAEMERMLIWRAAECRTPISASIELLPLCNMNCDMCFVRLSRKEMERQGRLRTAEEWLALARQMQRAGTLFLLLTGGEPLLYPDFKRLYLELKQLGMLLTLNTNGTLIDEEWAAFFGANPPRRINITLYGADERAYAELCHYPGGFERACRGIRLLREQGVEVKVASSLVRANEPDMHRIAALARSLDAAVHTDTYMFPATRERNRPFAQQARMSPEEAAQARIAMMKEEHTPEKYRQTVLSMLYTAAHTPPGENSPGGMQCMAGKCSLTVNWQGEMRPCVMLTQPSVPVFDVGFDAAWQQIMEETDRICLSAACSQCTMRSVCDVCAASALLETGRYDGTPEYMCRYTRETLRLLVQEAEQMMK